MWRMAGGQAAAWAPTARTGHADRRWWLPDVAIDRQLARPLPTATSAAAAFADLLRRPLSRLQILLPVGFMVGFGVVTSALQWILSAGDTTPRPLTKEWATEFAAWHGWSAVVFSLSIAIGIWWQMRGSLVLDFLRPVSRRDYWRGLSVAILHDLLLPLGIGSALLVGTACWWGQGNLLPWLVSALGFAGVVAMAPAGLLLIATGRTLASRTVGCMLVAVLPLGLGYAVNESFRHVWHGGAHHGWRAVTGAVILLVAGLAIRAAVFWRLEDREIG
jgi:hypothetical protein